MQELKVKSLLPVRLDKYLMQQFPVLGPGRLNKALRENKIKLNGKKQPLSTRVQNGDVIRIYLLDDQLGLTAQDGPWFLACRAPAELVYENDDLIMALKPAGIPVDGDDADTLRARVLRKLYEEKRLENENAIRLCHRLDTGTSGLILLAKNAETEQFLTDAIREHQIRKTYLCVTFGRPVPPADTLFDERRRARSGTRSGRAETRRQGDHHLLRYRRRERPPGPSAGTSGHRTHPPDPGAPGQHRLPDSGRQQVRQQCGQPGAQAEVPGPVCLGTGISQANQG